MNVIGLSAFHHDSACALVVEGRLVTAVREEWYSRLRHDRDLPLTAVRRCLADAGLGPGDIDRVAYYEDPVEKLSRRLWAELPTAPSDGPPPVPDDPLPGWEIRERLGLDVPIEVVGHHEAHAAAAFHGSGFPEAALFTAEAVGEWTVTGYGSGTEHGVTVLEDIAFPHSIGLLHRVVTAYLGFAADGAGHRLMSLASYGRPRYRTRLDALVLDSGGGGLLLDRRYLRPAPGGTAFTRRFTDLLGLPPRAPGSAVTRDHEDLASSVRSLSEDLLLDHLDHLHDLRPSDRLCYAGGPVLNALATTGVRRRGRFRDWFVPPEPDGTASAAGAALLVHHRHAGPGVAASRPAGARPVLQTPTRSVAPILRSAGVRHRDFTGHRSRLLDATAALLADGQVIGWFQGRLGYGAAAPAGRSVLADPRDPRARDRMALLIGTDVDGPPPVAAVAAEHAADYFDLDRPAPLTPQTVPVLAGAGLSAATHSDGTARVRTVGPDTDPFLHELLLRFGAVSGAPVLLDAPFIPRGEPMVYDESDALSCFVRARLDVLVVGDLLVRRVDLPPEWFEHADRERTFRRKAVRPGAYRFAG